MVDFLAFRAGIESFLGDIWGRTQDLIRESLDSEIELLNEANRFIFQHSGKQLRPLMSLLMASACSNGQVTEKSCHYAAVAELIHNASLLHDDVVDNSAARRGVPTIFARLGATPAVLIGDYWLSKAMDLISTVGDQGTVMRIFSKTLGDLTRGEMIQLQKSVQGDTTEEDYLKIIYCKTASLFESACVSAAVSVDAPGIFVDAARKYAVSMGMAFQIKDDILDYQGDGRLGKSVGVDIKEKKITLPLLGAFKETNLDIETKLRLMVSQMEEHPDNAARIIDFVRNSKGMEYAQQKVNGYVEEAIAALEVLPPSRAKDFLKEIAIFSISRTI